MSAGNTMQWRGNSPEEAVPVVSEREFPDSVGDIPKMERSPERTDIFEEGNPRSAETGCPHVPKEEVLGKKTSLSRVFWFEIRKNRRVYGLSKKGPAVQQEDYKDIVRLSREKIRKAN
ncbi:hypothetical protein TURU_103738 [Turdus rufiventris]|nr:hypothetical protein TURU_103738 [Turdus rufiventris]